MTATRADEWAAELSDAALEVELRHGVAGPSVEVELGVWHALEAAAQRTAAGAADAAYRFALARGFRGSFAELELDLWRALRRAASGRAGQPTPYFASASGLSVIPRPGPVGTGSIPSASSLNGGSISSS